MGTQTPRFSLFVLGALALLAITQVQCGGFEEDCSGIEVAEFHTGRYFDEDGDIVTIEFTDDYDAFTITGAGAVEQFTRVGELQYYP